MRWFSLFTSLALLLVACKSSKPASEGSPSEIEFGRAGDFPASNQVFGEAIFSEDVLVKWGYQTNEVASDHHSIRSKKNYGDSETAFYARFWLAKAKFENAADASEVKKEMEINLESDAGFKDYTQILQKGEFLYSFSATSNYTYLEHQPRLLELAKTYLENN